MTYFTHPFIRVCSALLVLFALVPLALGWSGGGNVWILLTGVLAGVLLMRAQAPEWRQAFLLLFLLALTTRVVVHVGVFGWARAADGPFLSPDATLYFRESLQLSMRDLWLPVPAYVFFGTFDCAHYYLFGAARWLLSAGLFDLQVLNIVLSALVGPLTYAMSRRMEVPHAFSVGVAVSLYPSLIALSVNDLMKDASVIGFFMIGTWAVVELWVAPSSWRRRLALMALAVATLSYVRMSRFYVPAFLELAVLGAMSLRLAKHLLGVPVARFRGAAALSLLATMALVEGVPMSFGWKSSPVMVWQALTHSLDTPEMRLSAVGLVDRIQADGHVQPRHRGDLSASGSRSVRAADVLAEVDGARRQTRHSAVIVPEPQYELEDVEEQLSRLSTPQKLTRFAANLVRKLFGPYPWVMPPSWDARTILVGDYLMFPGMLLWYLLLPLGVAGLLIIPWQALRDGHVSNPLLALTGFVGVLFVQYLVLNLSYRQREFMFPFLAMVAAFSMTQLPASKWPLFGYLTYLGTVVCLAIVHLALRSGLV